MNSTLGVSSLTLESAALKDWQGSLLIVPQTISSQSDSGPLASRVGDTVLVQAGAQPASLLVSLGKTEAINTEMARRAGGAAARWLAGHNINAAGLRAADLDSLGVDQALEAFCQGLMLAAFQFNRHKSAGEDSEVAISILADDQLPALKTRLQRTRDLCEAVNLARDVAHEPPNLLNPSTLAQRAAQIAAENGLKITVLGEKELLDLGAGAIRSVGLGSKTPSQMIILQYTGASGEQAQPVVVVGKAITFDTGGYSIKDRTGMVGMKYDKCGGATVLGIMQAVAQLKPHVPVIGIVAAAENMVSAEAYRPNDIITTLSGKTVEIISTDAEGRMVLADSLTYAHTHFKPRAIVDLATLTGGIVVALGKVRAGLMSNNDQLAADLMESGERTFERLWRMPLDDEYFELIRGDDSDFKNSSQVRQAHPIVGGIFLKQFVPDDVPWAHLDIAGPATADRDMPYSHKGATGFGVRLVVDWLQHLS